MKQRKKELIQKLKIKIKNNEFREQLTKNLIQYNSGDYFFGQICYSFPSSLLKKNRGEEKYKMYQNRFLTIFGTPISSY